MGHDTITAGQYRSGPHRHITSLDGGFLRGVPGTRGEKMNATLVRGGSDWILFDESTKTAHLDVRTQGRTPSGECVFIHYTGFLGIDEAAEKFMAWSPDAQTTEFGAHHWWAGPIIEASGMFLTRMFDSALTLLDPEFAWVKTTPFVGRGRWFRQGDIQAVEYEIYEVCN